MKKHITSTLVLVCICAVMAVILALTNHITAPIIKNNESQAANAALLEVMPDGKGFEKIDLEVMSYNLPATVDEVYKAENGGYVVKLVTTGYSSNFVIMCGVNADLTVSRALCLSSTETLGYEKTFGDNFAGKNADDVALVDTISGATKTTGAYKSAVADAINTAIILGGGSVDIRTEEEKLADALKEALPASEGSTFTKLFITEEIQVDAIYSADNGAGYVCAVGEDFISFDASLALVSGADEEKIAKALSSIEAMTESALTDIDTSSYEGLPKNLVHASVTASGNYVIEMKGAGYGIAGGDEYHPASGEYIVIRIAISKDGKILDCITLSQAETKGIGDACANESFYGQFDGKTEESYKQIDAISGATLTTNGYLKAIENSYKAVNIFKASASADIELTIDDVIKEDVTNE